MKDLGSTTYRNDLLAHIIHDKENIYNGEAISSFALNVTSTLIQQVFGGQVKESKLGSRYNRRKVYVNMKKRNTEQIGVVHSEFEEEWEFLQTGIRAAAIGRS
jgi:hypothetical protein